jgi:hypothetical protein
MATGQETDTAARIRRSYAAFNARDIDSALAAMHPDVDWPDAIDGGRLRGRDAVRRYWMRQFEVMDPRVEPHAIRVDGQGRVLVDVHQVVRDLKGQLVADEHVEHAYAIRGGVIMRMDIRQPSASDGSRSDGSASP